MGSKIEKHTGDLPAVSDSGIDDETMPFNPFMPTVSPERVERFERNLGRITDAAKRMRTVGDPILSSSSPFFQLGDNSNPTDD